MVDQVAVEEHISKNCRIRFLGTAGFTLVELIVVVAIVAILALMSIPVFTEYTTKTRNKRSIVELRTIDQAITAFILDKNTLPQTATGLSDVGMGNLKDPWNRPYHYQNLTETPVGAREYTSLGETNMDYDLYSTGSNGLSAPEFAGSGSADDLLRVNDGNYYSKRDEM